MKGGKSIQRLEYPIPVLEPACKTCPDRLAAGSKSPEMIERTFRPIPNEAQGTIEGECLSMQSAGDLLVEGKGFFVL